MKKIVIVSPRQGSGGAIVEHLLCKMLVERGIDARIFYFESDFTGREISSWRMWLKYICYLYHDTTKLIKCALLPKAKFIRHHRYKGYNYLPVHGCKRKYTPFVDDDTIVVYSEGIYGNPLKAKNVVRWFLYHNRYPNDENAYSKKDLTFSFRTIFNDYTLNPKCRLLRLMNFDYDLYKNHHNPNRKGCCYIIRKGWNREDLPKKMDGLIVDEMSEAEIVNTFNECKYCISYDTQTFYATIAAVCGCISIVVPEKGKKRDDYIGPEDKIYGVAYGFEESELEYAKTTMNKLNEEIEGFKEINKAAVESFIKECENRFYD